MKSVSIYQIKDFENSRYVLRSWESALKNNFTRDEYDKVYETQVNNAEDRYILDNMFSVFNIMHPEDFTGHSLSVSDVIQVDSEYYYCDTFGWKHFKSDLEKSSL